MKLPAKRAWLGEVFGGPDMGVSLPGADISTHQPVPHWGWE